MSAARPVSKVCVVCGRTFEWRKKWERDWEQVRYCGDRCRRTRLGELDRSLELAILELLLRRARLASICPSEAARAVDADGWQELMPRTRAAARRLMNEGFVTITQGGRPVDPSTAKGPIRVTRGTREAEEGLADRWPEAEKSAP